MVEQPHHFDLLEELSQRRIDVDQILDLHAQVKANTPSEQEMKSSNIAKTWARSGEFMLKTGNQKAAEVCFFMAVLYDKDNLQFIESLIDCYVVNRKYRYAIDFLQTLYLKTDETSDEIFWNKLVTILPIELIQGYLDSVGANNLDALVDKLELNREDPMTWMCLGYTIRANGLDPILANQALDNALALKYFD